MSVTVEARKLDSKKNSLMIDGRTVTVSNPQKILFPKTGFTKAQMIDYYVRVADALLPHIKGRPISMKRYPDGVDGESFFEKNCPAFRPAWFKTAELRHSSSGKLTNYCVVEDLASLVFIANLASIELHTFLFRQPDGDRPTHVAFDLDPGPGRTLVDCCRLGIDLRRMLQGVGLESFPKTSGGKGLHIYVPLNTAVTFAATREFALAVALSLERAFPKDVVSNMLKAKREGKMLVDWSQNNPHKTTVAPYSLRARETPTVSMPVDWKEVEAVVKRGKPEALVFTPEQAIARLAKTGDLFAPVLKKKQKLPTAKKI